MVFQGETVDSDPSMSRKADRRRDALGERGYSGSTGETRVTSDHRRIPQTLAGCLAKPHRSGGIL